MSKLTLYQAVQIGRHLALPLYHHKIPAGFPSPADDYVEKDLDLNQLLIRNPAATFFGRAEGFSMLNAGILPDDILVIDRSLTPKSGSIVVCALNGELTVKRLTKNGQSWQLCAENPDYPDITIPEGAELVVWGVVTYSIHAFQ